MTKTKIKKISFPVLISVISLNISIWFFCGAVIGYIFVNYFSKKIKSIKFSFSNYTIHLHHWLSASLALLIVIITGFYNSLPALLLGIGGGIAFEGIYCYNDWHKIIVKKNKGPWYSGNTHPWHG